MNESQQDRGIAFVSGPDGTILRVIRDELGPSSPFLIGTTFVSLMEGAAAATAVSFLAALHTRHAAFGWEMSVGVSGPMHFAGTMQKGQLIVVAAESGAAVTRISKELAAIDNQRHDGLPRVASREHRPPAGESAARDSRLYEDLSRLNNELTNLEREMVKKNVELERLNEQKDRILGMAAHDLRSPLGVILSYSEFLEEAAGDALNEEQREFVAIIKKTSRFMLRMVTDILDVTAIQTGQLTLDKEPTDLDQLIRHNVTLNRVLARSKGIAVELDPVAGLPPISVDAGKIEQVINNLVTNAVKFSERGTTVRVRLSRSDEFVTVAVEDQGQGIPAAELSKLFKPFGRTSVQSTAGEQSTGLGLAIVRNIVERHGGRIWLESEVGRGSTFFFTLPIV